MSAIRCAGWFGRNGSSETNNQTGAGLSPRPLATLATTTLTAVMNWLPSGRKILLIPHSAVTNAKEEENLRAANHLSGGLVRGFLAWPEGDDLSHAVALESGSDNGESIV